MHCHPLERRRNMRGSGLTAGWPSSSEVAFTTVKFTLRADMVAFYHTGALLHLATRWRNTQTCMITVRSV